MPKDNIVRHLLAVFAVTAAVYFGLFQFNEWLRTRRGAWELFFSNENGTPSLSVREAGLGIDQVRIRFQGETAALPSNQPVALRFDAVTKTNLPFGTVVFHDLTYQPGTMTMNVFGHEVELIPRTLVVNRHEVPWTSATNLVLQPSEKLPPEKLKLEKPRRQKKQP